VPKRQNNIYITQDIALLRYNKTQSRTRYDGIERELRSSSAREKNSISRSMRIDLVDGTRTVPSIYCASVTGLTITRNYCVLRTQLNVPVLIKHAINNTPVIIRYHSRRSRHYTEISHEVSDGIAFCVRTHNIPAYYLLFETAIRYFRLSAARN